MRYKKGVTLIELLIVIAIIGIMSAVFMTMLSKSTRTQKELEVEARKVLAVMEETRNLSLTGKNADSGCSNIFTATVGTSNYGISGCNTVNYTLENGITFNSGGSFSFNVPHGDISSGSSFPIDINLQKNGKNYHICIYETGKINLNGATGC